MSSTRILDDDPWTAIETAVPANEIVARRISGIGSSDWGLYWGIDAQNQCLLILQHKIRDLYGTHRFPRLMGLIVETVSTSDFLREQIVIRLTDGEQRGLFYKFCVDIVDATRSARTESEAITRFLTRTWMWHRLLKNGASGRLSDNEQKGLIGELRVIERYLLGFIPAADIIESWGGPLGSPKDFQLGLVAVEAKTHAPENTEINISSIDQLDSLASDRLFLSVTEVASAPIEPDGSFSVSEIANRVRETVMALDPVAVITFDERLAAIGFDRLDDYSDRKWLIGDETLYEIVEGFPRITNSMIPPPIVRASYTIPLTSCENFRTDTLSLREAISGELNGT